jgi:hypothetical protein
MKKKPELFIKLVLSKKVLVNVKMGSNKEGIISPKCEQKIPSSSLHTDD